MQRNTLLGWAGGAAIGIVIGGAAMYAYDTPPSGGAALEPLPTPAEGIKGKRDPKSLQLEGKSRASISNFSIEDPEGHEVLQAKEIGAALDLEALASHLVRMPTGHARGVHLLLRRGKSGRVSLAEALGKREGAEKGESLLAIGPLAIDDARVDVAVNERPVAFQIDSAKVQVQKKRGDAAPRVFLSGIHGYMADPDPLPQPIRIRGGRGVIDLAGDPLVDIRARVCIGGGELRVQIEIPERHGAIRLRVDAEGFSARSALVALNMVSKFKERLEVTKGPVEVSEPYDCTRAEGREARREAPKESKR